MPSAPLTPALYDAVVTHTRRERRRRTFTHRIYLWLVDIDALPGLPRWLTPYARFEARDHRAGWRPDVGAAADPTHRSCGLAGPKE